MYKIMRFLSVLLIVVCLVSACNNPVQQFPQSTLEPTAKSFIEKVDDLILTDVKDGNFSGSVFFYQDDEILLNKGYGYSNRAKKILNSHDTRFRLDEISMSFASVAIWMLYEQGKLELQDSICQYIENCPKEWQDITIQELLDNVSNLPDFMAVPDIKQILTESNTLDDLVNQVEKLELSTFSTPTSTLGDSSYILFMSIIEKASGKDYETFLKENIFQPLGMKNSGVIHSKGENDQLAMQYSGSGETDLTNFQDALLMGENIFNMYSIVGLYSTTEDVYRFLDALTTQKILNGEKIKTLTGGKELIPWWTENKVYAPGSGWVDFRPWIYYTTIWIAQTERPGSSIIYDPETNTGLIVLTNQEKVPEYSIFVDWLTKGE